MELAYGAGAMKLNPVPKFFRVHHVVKNLLAIPCALALTTMAGHSALVLTFEEIGGDVRLTYSGSVDLTNANFPKDARDFVRCGSGSHDIVYKSNMIKF